MTHPSESVRSLQLRLAQLLQMSVSELQCEWQRVFNEPARSRNRASLLQRLSYRIQELAQGGLSERARKRARELAAESPIRRQLPGAEVPVAPPPVVAATEPHGKPRDPRLPPAGTMLRKVHGAREH